MITRNYLLTMALSLLATMTAQAGDYAKYYDNLPTKVQQVIPIQIPQNSVTLTDFGAVGDGVTLCTDAFKKGIAKLTAQGGGRLNVPEGVWLTGPIEMKDNIELHLDKNAIIYFSPDKRLYFEGEKPVKRVNPCIYATKAKNLAITGEGIIDGNGQQWRPVKRGKMSDVEWNQYNDMGGKVTEKGDLWYPWQLNSGYPDIADTPQKQEGMRNDLVRFELCENILLTGVTFQNSPRFHVHPCYCKNIIIDGITVRCPWNVQNGDGIDLSDCHQALIVNSTVNVGDDGLCMKSGSQKKNAPWGCQDILIQDNTVYHAHGGFVLGSETIGGIRDMVVRHNRFLGTDVGLRFKSGVGRGGKTERMYISDIMMADIKDYAIVFQCDYVNRPAGSENAKDGSNKEKNVKTLIADTKNNPVVFQMNDDGSLSAASSQVPDFQDIHIQRVVCRGVHTGIKAAGIEGKNCIHDIDISDCSIIYNKVAAAIDESTAQLKLNNVNLTENKLSAKVD